MGVLAVWLQALNQGTGMGRTEYEIYKYFTHSYFENGY